MSNGHGFGDAPAPGFATATAELPACANPRQAFELLCDAADDEGVDAVGSKGVTLAGWLRLSATLGVADLVTADSTFDQLSSSAVVDDPSVTPPIPILSFEVFEKYVSRIAEKAAPGASSVGGWIDQSSADAVLQAEEVTLATDERVLMAGGVPAYAVLDMVTTPRSGGALILTSHALYWRPSGLRKMLSNTKIRRFELLPKGQVPPWVAEAYRTGPMGLGVTDTSLRLTRARMGARDTGGGGVAEDHEAVFNFPLHQGHRDLFIHAIGEVVAAHSFSVKRLGHEEGTLCPAVSQGMIGSLIRCRAARGIVSSEREEGLVRLPFTLAMAESPDSPLPGRLADLFREAASPRSAGGPEPEPEVSLLEEETPTAVRADAEETPRTALQHTRRLQSINTALLQATASEAVAAAVTMRREQAQGQKNAAKTFLHLPGEDLRDSKYQRVAHAKALIEQPIVHVNRSREGGCAPAAEVIPLLYCIYMPAIDRSLSDCRWERPGFAMIAFVVAQWLVLGGLLHYVSKMMNCAFTMTNLHSK